MFDIMKRPFSWQKVSLRREQNMDFVKYIGKLLTFYFWANSSCASGQINISETFQVVLGIQKFFTSNCIYLVTSRKLDRNDNLVQINKFLSNKGMFTATIPIDGLENSFGTVQKSSCIHPMYVFINIEEVTLQGSQVFTKHVEAPGSIWLVFLQDGVSLEGSFFKVNIPFDCELLVAQPSRGDIRLVELYRVAQHSALEIHDFGSWSPHDGFTGPSSKYIYRRRNNLRGAVLKTTSIDYPGYMALRKTDNKTLMLGGFFSDVWKIFEGQMQFRSEHGSPDDGNWGSIHENGTWDGMVGVVLRREADLAAMGIGMTSERARYISYATPHFMTYEKIFISEPKRVMSLGALTSPFAPQVWVAWTMSWIVTVLFLEIFSKINLHLYRYIEDDQCSLQETFLFIFGMIFCAQGQTQNFNLASNRIVVIFAYIIGMVAFASYSCSLISSLTVYIPKTPFTSLEDLSEDGSYSLGTLRTSRIHSRFKTAPHGTIKDVYRKLILPDPANLPDTPEEAFKRVCERNYGFITPDEIIYSIDIDCKIVALPFQKLPVGYAFPRHSPYFAIFNHNILKLLTSGIMGKIYKDTFKQKLPSGEDKPEPVTIETVLPIVTILSAGVLVSLFILVLEILVNVLNKIKKK